MAKNITTGSCCSLWSRQRWCTFGIATSYSTTNKIHLLSQIIYSCKTLYMFRTVSAPSHPP